MMGLSTKKMGHMTNNFEFTVSWCKMCGHHIVCPKCGNNCCNGGYGTVNDEPCDICSLAYQYQELMWDIVSQGSCLEQDSCWCNDCIEKADDLEDLELSRNPDFIAAMTRIIDAVDNTDFDFSKVKVAGASFVYSEPWFDL